MSSCENVEKRKKSGSQKNIMKKYKSYVRVIEGDVKRLEKYVEELKKSDITQKEIYDVINKIYLNINDIKSYLENIEKLFELEGVDSYVVELVYNLFDVFVKAWENGESNGEKELYTLLDDISYDMKKIIEEDPRFDNIVRRCSAYNLAETFVYYFIHGETYSERDFHDRALHDVGEYFCEGFDGNIYDLEEIVSDHAYCVDLYTRLSEALPKLIEVKEIYESEDEKEFIERYVYSDYAYIMCDISPLRCFLRMSERISEW